jgi:hypothetical protein
MFGVKVGVWRFATVWMIGGVNFSVLVFRVTFYELVTFGPVAVSIG